jgi:hypothetical protein
MKEVTSQEEANLLVFYSPSASEIRPGKRGGLIKGGLLYDYHICYYFKDFDDNHNYK